MIKEVHIFKAGTQTSAQGITREFTQKDLKEIAQSYNPGVHEAPIRIGHEDNDKVPAWGWVKGVKVKGDELFAEIDFSPLAEDYISNGLYKKVSASFYSPESKINPEPGKWSLRHVALLGAQPPAVKGLKGFAYEESDDGIVDFATTLTPDAVFDPELGPTLKKDIGPLELLKEKLDEARAQMNTKEEVMEQQIEAPAEIEEETAEGEFAEGAMMGMKKPKKMKGEKMGEEDPEEEDEDTMMAAEMADKDLPEALKKNAAKKMAKKRGISEEEAMGEKDMEYGSCGTKGKKMNYEESDSEDHQEVEEADGEGPVASKVKKQPKNGEAMEEGDEEMYMDPTFEPSKKKRGADSLASSDTGVTPTEGGPGGLVRTKSSSKGVNLGFAEEEELEDDDEQHAETDDNKYVDKTTEPKRGKDGMKGRKVLDANNDQSGRGEVGKAGVEGETGRGKKGTAPEIKGFEGDEKGTDEEISGYNGETGKSAKMAEDRKKTGKGPEMKGYPDKYMGLGNGGGKGKQVKGSGVRVMYVNHSEEAPVSKLEEMMARLEELEAANAKLKADAEFAERKAHRMQLAQFAEGLYETGKLTEAVVAVDELVDYMEGLEYGTLEFAEGETAATPLMRILENLPSQVCYAELAGGETVAREEDLDPHEKALKISREEEIEYAEALKRVLFTAE
jgi:hypothetical protein